MATNQEVGVRAFLMSPQTFAPFTRGRLSTLCVLVRDLCGIAGGGTGGWGGFGTHQRWRALWSEAAAGGCILPLKAEITGSNPVCATLLQHTAGTIQRAGRHLLSIVSTHRLPQTGYWPPASGSGPVAASSAGSADQSLQEPAYSTASR